MHNLFNTKLYLKQTPKFFDAPSFQGFLLSFHCDTIVIQVTASRTELFYCILLDVLIIISFYVTATLYVTATVY